MMTPSPVFVVPHPRLNSVDMDGAIIENPVLPGWQRSPGLSAADVRCSAVTTVRSGAPTGVRRSTQVAERGRLPFKPGQPQTIVVAPGSAGLIS